MSDVAESVALRQEDEAFSLSEKVQSGAIDLSGYLLYPFCERWLRAREEAEVESSIDDTLDSRIDWVLAVSKLSFLKSKLLLPLEEAAEDVEAPPIAEWKLSAVGDFGKIAAASQILNQNCWLYRDVYPASQSHAAHAIPTEVRLEAPVRVDLFDLLLALKSASDRTSVKPLVVQTPEHSMLDIVYQIQRTLNPQGPVEMTQFLPSAYRISELILTFITVLELTKLQYISLTQEKNFGKIWITQKNLFNAEEIILKLN